MRFLDFLLAFIGLSVLSPLLIVLFIIGVFDTGSPLFFQERVGRYKKPFTLVKFRTMSLGTESKASHLVSSRSVTRLGSFLRKTKLDELPQLWNVLKGDMSLVGPRPNLYNQQSVLDARDSLNVYDVRPGITGLAQIKDIDMSSPKLLAIKDSEMISKLSITSYLNLVLLTIVGKGRGDRVRK